MSTVLRAQHGSAINPADAAIVAAVTVRLSALAETGESFTTPDAGETRWASAFGARAVAWSGRKVRKVRGAEWQECHAITSRVVAQDPTRYHHVFGYALDSDTHWRTHSWILDIMTGELIEPTPSVRKAYIGVELTPEEAAIFAAE